MTWRSSNGPKERIFACLPYALPLVEVTVFGTALFRELPEFATIYLTLLYPFMAVYGFISNLFPFAGLILFFVLLLAVVRNDRVQHFIRYNTMQAILISIFATLCQLVLQLFGIVGSGFGNALSAPFEVFFNLIFLVVVASCVYSIVQCARGLYPDNIPLVSDAARAQVP
ncbi:MAG: Tic20 family protein [Cyanobacteriota bacterium]|nr:Tic20 family protein [Cyanobacteriota bacterium]